MSLRTEIKKKVEYILRTEEDQAILNQLNEQLATYQKKLEESAWERTPELEKQRIRASFESLKSKANRLDAAEMEKFAMSWRERLFTQE